MTKEEKILWALLRDRRSRNIKFRRQVNIGPYIADFLCKELRIIIEVDGGIHNNQEQMEHDNDRDSFLGENGYKIIRITNEEIRNSLPLALERIHLLTKKQNNKQKQLPPLHRGGEGGGGGEVVSRRRGPVPRTRAHFVRTVRGKDEIVKS